MQLQHQSVHSTNPEKIAVHSDGQGSQENFNSSTDTAESKCNSGVNSNRMGAINRFLQSQL